uniref:Protein SRC2 n=1 Tax=Elaeis guineensis var. tenera TaxID=51953 RepID=A0A6I9R9K2_ELAGV|nr:protein SRC2 [Elaeis guineensis]XP_010922807.1 protein SRC2 [Elaeis guineensis]
MAKIRIEVCVISARGLHRSSPFLKPQWFAVGWIDPNNKYCTKIDNSGSSNPTWKTKFSISIDDTNSNLQGLSLTIEVYRREPIFLRESLQGTAVVQLREFLAKFYKDAEPSRSGIEETGSFQLRKRNSGKPQGFVDISLRIMEQRGGVTSHPGLVEESMYSDHASGITLATEDGPVIAFPAQPQQPPLGQFGGHSQNNYPYGHPMPPPVNHPYPSESGTGYHRPPTPPPPPPPSNTGFLPPLFPGTSHMPENYVNVPPSGPAGRSSGPGFGMGLGAGALAAGAVIFGDDFMSSANIPAGFESGSLIVSTDPPF